MIQMQYAIVNSREHGLRLLVQCPDPQRPGQQIEWAVEAEYKPYSQLIVAFHQQAEEIAIAIAKELGLAPHEYELRVRYEVAQEIHRRNKLGINMFSELVEHLRGLLEKEAA